MLRGLGILALFYCNKHKEGQTQHYKSETQCQGKSIDLKRIKKGMLTTRGRNSPNFTHPHVAHFLCTPLIQFFVRLNKHV